MRYHKSASFWSPSHFFDLLIDFYSFDSTFKEIQFSFVIDEIIISFAVHIYFLLVAELKKAKETKKIVFLELSWESDACDDFVI